MQTFLPFHDFSQTAQCLDQKRLGKQRVETKQILETLLNIRIKFDGTNIIHLEPSANKAWQNHPAILMWKNYEFCLAYYGIVICNHWINHYGFKDSCKPCFSYMIQSFVTKKDLVFPSWLGNQDFHKSHQSNLLRKNPDHYTKFFPDVPHDLPYIWPKQSIPIKIIGA